MNLTPVEQYYAEMLSILDMRKHPFCADNLSYIAVFIQN